MMLPKAYHDAGGAFSWRSSWLAALFLKFAAKSVVGIKQQRPSVRTASVKLLSSLVNC